MDLTEPIQNISKAATTAVYRFTTTRAVLIVTGIISGFLAWSTYHSYTVRQLSTRNWCCVILVALCVIGIGSIFVKPNPMTRSSVGLLLFLHSWFRAWAFAAIAWHKSNGIIDFLGDANAMYVHMLVGYLGLLVWGRAKKEVVN